MYTVHSFSFLCQSMFPDICMFGAVQVFFQAVRLLICNVILWFEREGSISELADVAAISVFLQYSDHQIF